jgi:hypothetical protein
MIPALARHSLWPRSGGAWPVGHGIEEARSDGSVEEKGSRRSSFASRRSQLMGEAASTSSG